MTNESNDKPKVTAPPEPPPQPPKPKFDPNAPHGTLYSSGYASDQGPARFVQNGHYFAADGTYLRSDASAVRAAERAKPQRLVNNLERLVEPEEMVELLKDPRAEALINMPLESLASLSRVNGGPTYGGDNAPSLYAAWLLKYAGA